jgi:membrane protease YdiL (CAAX protease family)
MMVAMLSGVLDPDGLRGMLGEAPVKLAYIDAVISSVILLATFAGLWIGVLVAAKVIHGRMLWSVVSYAPGFNFAQFGWGVGIGVVYLLVGVLSSFVTGHPPTRTDVEIGPWLWGLAPICIVLLIQTSGEELFFRGYLVQQLAARFRHPLVWGLLPAFVFGLGHYANATTTIYSLYYVAATTLFGVVAVVLLWRTGSLAAPIGLHFVNNIGAFNVAGAEGVGPQTYLWSWTDNDIVAGAPVDLISLCVLLAFVLSPWAPFPKGQPLPRRNDTRAAP